MLDDDDGVATVDEFLEHVDQDADVFEMQAGGGLVENVEGLSGVALREFGGQLHSLALSAREGGGWLSQLDIAEAHVLNGLYLAQYIWHIFKEFHGLVDGHVEHVGYGFSLVAHLERLAVVTLAVTDLAGNHHVGQEIHFDAFVAIAATDFAPSALHIEREAARLVAADFCLGKVDEQRADVGEHAGIGGRVGAGSAADGCLVHIHHLIYIIYAFHGIVGHGLFQRAVEMLREDGLQGLVDKC